jgi:A/G-specific adenine glycosylase
MSNGKKYFTKQLLEWNKMENDRPMPWKGEKDPYKIWLSEIILQQTRVAQGWEYYNRFIATFPDVKKLAKASNEKVFKLWEGLGYYTRCKNLIATAKLIAKEKEGVFPDTYTEIISLKGIGPYTAAAIASFAYNLPHAVVDGNVFRVLSRFFGIETPTDSTTGKKLFTALAEELLDKTEPGIYNQAIMDFGAVICKPQSPLCVSCPLINKCEAFLHQKIDELPVKTGKMKKKARWFYYFIVEYGGKIYVRKRGPKEIWENLYEFVLFESDKLLSVKELQSTEFYKNTTAKNKAVILQVSQMYKQQLTHQTIRGCFIQVKLQREPLLRGYKPVTYNKISKLPFPKFITGYLAENELQSFER